MCSSTAFALVHAWRFGVAFVAGLLLAWSVKILNPVA